MARFPMRCLLVLMVLNLSLLGCPGDEVDEPGTPRHPPAAPKVVFEEYEFDAGEGQRGDVKKHKFRFRNVGRAPLQIKQLVTKCGCVAVASSHDEVPPGESSEILVSLTLKRGPTEQEVFVVTDDPHHDVIPLIIRGTGQVKYDLDLAPQEFRLGTVVAGEVTKRSAVLSNFVEGASETARSVAFSTSTPEIQIIRQSEWKESPSGAGDGSVHRTLEFDMEVRAPEIVGPFHGFVDAEIHFDSEIKTMRIPIIARAESPVRVVPARVFLKPVPIGTTSEFSRVVSNAGNRALTTVAATTTIGDSIQLVSTDSTPDGTVLRFRFVPESVGIVAGEIQVKVPETSDETMGVFFGAEVTSEDARHRLGRR